MKYTHKHWMGLSCWIFLLPSLALAQCHVVSSKDTLRIPTDSLLVYLSFDQGFLDISGNNYHPMFNNLARSQGIRGMCANFFSPFSNKELILPPQLRFQPLQSYSISLWLLTAQTSRFSLLEQRTGSFDPDSANFAWYLNTSANPNSHEVSFPMFLGHPTVPYQATQEVPFSQATDSTWHHYILVKDVDGTSATFRLYEDACLLDTLPVANGNFAVDGLISIGNDYLENDPFVGLLDEFRIYNRALSTEDVYALYNLFIPMHIDVVDSYCDNGQLEVCIRNPQPNTSYQIVNESGTIVQSTAGSCNQLSTCLRVQSYVGDSLFLQGQNGNCVRTLRLLSPIHPPQQLSIDTAICPGDTFFFQGSPYTMADTFTISQSQNGCQTLTNLNISFKNPVSTRIDSSICEGDSVSFMGNVLRQTGSYSFVDSSAACIEKITYNLMVEPKQNIDIDTTLCAGDSLILDGVIVKNSGTYVLQQDSSGLCGSTLTYRVREQACSLNNGPIEDVGLPQNLFDLAIMLQTGSFGKYEVLIFDFTGRLLDSFNPGKPLDREEVGKLLGLDGPFLMKISLFHGKKVYHDYRKVINVK